MSKKIFLIIFLLLLATLAGLYVIFDVNKNNVVNYHNENALTDANNQTMGPGLPLRLTIPSINVDTEIIRVGLDNNGSVAVPEGPSQVAWFQLGPRPGQKGSAIITGHFGPWKNGAHSVFDNLDKLKPGDKIYVKNDQDITLTFTVRESRIYDASETPAEVFNKNNGIYLNLITCNGDWIASQKTYTKRLVVFTNAV